MKKKYLNIYRDSDRNDATNKPKKDINKILTNMLFSKIDQPMFKSRYAKLIGSFKSVKNIVRHLNRGDLLIVQYPTYMGTLFDLNLADKLRAKGVKTIVIIHDIDSLRFKSTAFRGLDYEVTLLNKFDELISPNMNMTKLLKSKGLKAETVNLEIFDYLTNTNEKSPAKFERLVSFTGNLNKSDFIRKLDEVNKVRFNLFGPLKAKGNINGYVGSFDSDELIIKIKSGFGLVWDGSSIRHIYESDISTGSYLKYNNPYKLSFYIVIGVPIFIWNKAAEAEFVVKEGIGIPIGSIEEIPTILNEIGNEDYKKMVINIDRLKKRITSGYYTKLAVKKALDNL